MDKFRADPLFVSFFILFLTLTASWWLYSFFMVESINHDNFGVFATFIVFVLGISYALMKSHYESIKSEYAKEHESMKSNYEFLKSKHDGELKDKLSKCFNNALLRIGPRMKDILDNLPDTQEFRKTRSSLSSILKELEKEIRLMGVFEDIKLSLNSETKRKKISNNVITTIQSNGITEKTDDFNNDIYYHLCWLDHILSGGGGEVNNESAELMLSAFKDDIKIYREAHKEIVNELFKTRNASEVDSEAKEKIRQYFRELIDKLTLIRSGLIL